MAINIIKVSSLNKKSFMLHQLEAKTRIVLLNAKQFHGRNYFNLSIIANCTMPVVSRNGSKLVNTIQLHIKRLDIFNEHQSGGRITKYLHGKLNQHFEYRKFLLLHQQCPLKGHIDTMLDIQKMGVKKKKLEKKKKVFLNNKRLTISF